jgi:oxygen-independent coproporphyrinogen-3 oxidase
MRSSELQLPPLSLYVHIPWCIKKCPYCDFNSHTSKTEIPEKEYLISLIDDLNKSLNFVQSRKLSSIFFGGGTPSLFSARAIGEIISAADSQIGFDKNIEITLEVNPGTFEQKKFSDYKINGINRLSIGIQSFDDNKLLDLGRIHSSEQAISAVEKAKLVGFDNINLDLMYGLPKQAPTQAMNDLRLAIELAPKHISWYQLTIEPNTEFFNKPPLLANDVQIELMQDEGKKLLANAGYEQYEISAYCKVNKKSLHNMNYWKFGDYIGIGAGAHGKVTLAEEKRIVRTQKTRSPKDYLDSEKSYTSSFKEIDHKDLPLEFMMNILRINRGVPREVFKNRTGLSYAIIEPSLVKLKRRLLIEDLDEVICSTHKGRLFLNSVLEYF